MRNIFLLSVILLGVAACNAQSIPDEDWGYVEVRPGAHSFWWLYGSTSGTRSTDPLIIWLQGGPGASSTGFGNFGEIGPLDVNLQPRNQSWVSTANVLFIDNPVGAGFSYVDDLSLLPKTNDDISADLVALLTAFVNKYPIFQQLPLHIFCESYGGKMTVGFANAILAAQTAGKLSVNLKGVALGDSWISPQDFVESWGPFLKSVSLIDDAQLTQLEAQNAALSNAINAGQWEEATAIWDKAETMVESFTDNVNFYNFLQHNVADGDVTTLRRGSSHRRLSAFHTDPLTALMNGPIRQKLKVIPPNVSWGGQSNDVFSALRGDFMRPVVDGVDHLLNAGNVQVVVYQGQLDVICATPGADAWMKKLKWSGMSSFNKAAKTAFTAETAPAGQTGGFVKSYNQLRLYLIMSAGHMVPSDNPAAALYMVNQIIGK